MPGSVQKILLEIIRDMPNIEANALLWLAAEKKGKFVSANIKSWIDPYISQAFYQSFRRALLNLTQKEQIFDQKLTYSSYEDLAKHYPYKTRNYNIKKYRLKWITHFGTYIQNKERESNFDEILIDRMRKNKDFKSISNNWQYFVEKKLMPNISTDAKLTDLLIALYTRIQQIFFNAVLKTSEDIASLKRRVEQIESNNKQINELKKDFLNLYEKTFISQIDYYEVKNKVLNAIDPFQQGKHTLRSDFIKYLLEVEPELSKFIPDIRVNGYELNMKKDNPKKKILFLAEKNYSSEILDKVFCATIYHKNIFYSIKNYNEND